MQSGAHSKFFDKRSNLALGWLVLGAFYFGASRLGFLMALEAEQVTVVWPPTGLALAALLLFGYRLWPGIMLGAFFTNAISHETILTALSIASGNTLEAVAGAWLLRRAGCETRLGRMRDVFGIVVLSASVSTTISATVGVTSLCLGGSQPWTAWYPLWRLWWLGDATGALIFAPVLLVWGSGPWRRWPTHALSEAAFLAAILIAASIGIFTEPSLLGITGEESIYLIFPFIIWAALRFGQRGTTFVTLTASIIATCATMHELGPFIGGSVSHNLTQLQVFMAVVATTGLILSAAITEREQAEAARRRLASIVESSQDAIYSVDLNGIINFWNAGAERLFGYSAAEAIGQPVALLIPPDRRKKEYEILQKLQRGERLEHYETIRLAKNGRPIDISLTVSPIYDDRGTVTAASKVARDITERKRTEEALKESDRRKEEFLATLAHELRNPLAPLANALDFLRRPETHGERRQEALGIMNRQVRQIVRLVDDLLDVSRISHGKIELRPERVTLAQVIEAALETVRPTMQENKHTLSVELPKETLWLNADPTRLAQIFANLLGNSAKYTPPGGHIWLQVSAEDGNAVIRVRDTGIGIPPDMLPKVFDMFTQADSSIERAHGGLGIGLTLVKNLVERHGGRVEAASQGVNRGSQFTVTLPLAQAPQLPAITSAFPSPTSQKRPLRVLIVDDNETVAKTLGWMTESMGHEVMLAHDGPSALEAGHSFQPDVILLDIGLSGSNGYDVCRQMRADPALKNCIIAAQTGWGQREHRERSKAAGFDRHLVKPLMMETLEDLFASLHAPTS